MTEKPISVILIAFYCFFFDLFLLLFSSQGIVNRNAIFSTTDFGLWSSVVIPVVFIIIFIILGIGILNLNRACWKGLFYLLLTSVSTIASLILSSVLLAMASVFFDYSFIPILNLASSMWFPFLFCFLSQIIVLYYLTRQEVRSLFGE